MSGLPAASSANVPKCRKCGVNGNFGKLNCCARGGSWHKKCGNVNDPRFNYKYDWAMGAQACKKNSDGNTTVRASVRPRKGFLLLLPPCVDQVITNFHPPALMAFKHFHYFSAYIIKYSLTL